MVSDQSPLRRKSAVILWGLSLALLFLGSALLLVLFLPPYHNARALADQLAKDGTMETFTQGFYQAARLPALAGGAVLLVLTVLGILQRRRILRWVSAGLDLPGRLKEDLLLLLADLREDRLPWKETALLLGLVLLAIVARGAFIMRPLEHDEAYTVVNFAAAPLREGLSNYYLPNNHLFHTLLARLAFLLWGYQPWAMRLPAFIAGVLSIPLVYFLARSIYHRTVAVTAAAGTAALPVLVYYGTNARGYTLIIDFTLLIFLLGLYVRKHANFAAWALIILFSALGMYTVPIFMYPLGALLAWLFVSMLVGETGEAYGRWGMLKWLVAAGVVTVLLTLLLYLPVFLRFDIHPLFFKDMAGPHLSWSAFFPEARPRLDDSVAHFLMQVPPALGTIAVIGFLLSLVPWTAPTRESDFARWRVPLQIVTVAWTVSLVIGMRTMPYARFFIFLVPLLMIWAAAGWVGLVNLLQKWLPRIPASAGLAGLVVLTAAAGTGWRIATMPEANLSLRGDVEQVALFLKSQVRDNDLVVVNSPHDAQLWYYTRLYGINPDHFKRELPFFRAFVLVDPAFQQTLDSVMEERGPEKFFFDFTAARKVYQAGSIQVIEMIPYQDLIRREYHLP